jgi:hypothetical protein
MKRRLLVPIAVLALALASGGVIYAITNGHPDGNNHPYVGILVFDDAAGPAWRCSGALIADNVVLTAGHCTDGALKARVWFASDIRTVTDWPAGGTMAIEGTPHTHPGFVSKFIDVGVVVLDQPVTGLGEAVLPTAGIVDSLPMMADVDLVGYGVQWKRQVSGPPQGRWAWNGLRYFARSKYIGSEQKSSIQFLKLTANPGADKGGLCFGDSGGPDLLGNVVLGVNSFVTNYNCAGVTYSMRIDRADVLGWVNGFLLR